MFVLRVFISILPNPQTTFKDFPSPDIARSLTGPDILQKHSINSLLLEHNEIISRGLSSPIEDNMSLADLLGGSQPSSPTSASASLVTNSSSSMIGKGGGGTSHYQNSIALGHPHHHSLLASQHQQQQQNHQQHHSSLGSFVTLGSSLGSNTVAGATICDDSASSILSSGGGNSATSGGGSVSSNPFNFASLRIPSPSLNSPDLLMNGGLIGGGIAGSSSSSSSSSSSGVSCGEIGSAGSGQSPTSTHSFYSSLLPQILHQPGSSGSSGTTTDALMSGSTNGSDSGVYERFRFDLMLNCGSDGITAQNGLTTETLKQKRRNISFDCSSPTNGPSSSGEGTSPSFTLLYPNNGRNYRNGNFSQPQQNTTSPHSHQQQSTSVQQYDILSGGNGGTSGNSGGITTPNNASISMGDFDSIGTSNSSLSLFDTGNVAMSRSHTPPNHSDTSNLLTTLETTSILDMLNLFTHGQSANSLTGQHHSHTQQQQQQPQNQFTPYIPASTYQQSTASGAYSGINSSNNGSLASLSDLSLGSSVFNTDYERMQKIQTYNNTLRFLQQQSQQKSQLQQLQFNQSLLSAATVNSGNVVGSCSNISTNITGGSIGSSNTNNHSGGLQRKNWFSSSHQQHRQGLSSPSLNGGGNGYTDVNLDRIAKIYRSSAAHYDATCTWSGVLPPRSNRLVTYSSKIFLGGMPWDISEQSLVQIFKPFGSIKVEWPGKEQQATQPKGYVYIIFESDKQVKALLQACTYTTSTNNGSIHGNHGGINVVTKINFKISSKRIKSKDVEVIPWNIADSNYVKSSSQKLDPTKTVFVGALHGQLTAEGLSIIMNDLFEGVVYVGIDTDKYKYPLGSARVTFSNARSYMKAVSAAFIEIRTAKFTKKLQVDPYLEDSLCSICNLQHGPYFCRESICFRYYCRSCWQDQHSRGVYLQNHKPLTRNSKFTAIIGVGPQQQSQPATTGSNSSNHHLQQHSYDHSPYYNGQHHHHHHNGSGSHTHNQYYHHNNNNTHQQSGNRLGLLQQQQQQYRVLAKSPSPSICSGTESSSIASNGNISYPSSNSSSPVGGGNNARSNNAASRSNNNSLNGNNNVSSNNAGNSGNSGEHSSSCIGSLHLQQHNYVAGSGGNGNGNGNGGSGLHI
ncbi:DEP domain-containing protein DDB_G0279099 [Anopheles marshallii]|uniref:DEP domain-containing protein DDB_G0279099 n=1 Tax=Anopheles marshallii TaxID=1521116 RepID=UPI00237C0962|nr:DEP domain-containing protein DDB_G0279099 [Anopheles marshallii]